MDYEDNVIRIHPAIVHLFDGDFDGDQMHVVAVTSPKAIQDLQKMDVLTFIKNNPQDFSPGKEFKLLQPEEGWATESSEKLHHQINTLLKMSTSGRSISYHDILNDREKTDQYFDPIKKINRRELAHFGHGINESEVTEESKEGSEIRGTSSTDAVQSYRVIKQGVARFGGLTNSLMTLAIAKKYKKIPIDELRQILIDIAEIKHALCQDGLSAKHGQNTMAANKKSEELFMSFYSKAKLKESKEDYLQLMKELGLPDQGSKTVIDIFWEDPPVPLNNQLRDIAPTYMSTRRSHTLTILFKAMELKNEVNLNTEFLQIFEKEK